MNEILKDFMMKEICRLNALEEKTDGFNCPLCGNKGFTYAPVERENDIEVNMLPCRCVYIKKLLRQIWGGKTPPGAIFNGEGGICDEEYSDFIKRTVEYNHWGFIYGKNKDRKRRLLSALAVSNWNSNKKTLYVDWNKESPKLRYGISEKSLKSKAFCGVDLLILDNFMEVGKVSPGAYSFIINVLNERSHGKATIIINKGGRAQIKGGSHYLDSLLFRETEGMTEKC